MCDPPVRSSRASDAPADRLAQRRLRNLRQRPRVGERVDGRQAVGLARRPSNASSAMSRSMVSALVAHARVRVVAGDRGERRSDPSASPRPPGARGRRRLRARRRRSGRARSIGSSATYASRTAGSGMFLGLTCESDRASVMRCRAPSDVRATSRPCDAACTLLVDVENAAVEPDVERPARRKAACAKDAVRARDAPRRRRSESDTSSSSAPANSAFVSASRRSPRSIARWIVASARRAPRAIGTPRCSRR